MNITEEIRKNIWTKVEELTLQGNSVEEVINYVCEWIYQLQEITNCFIATYLLNALSTFYIDAYKMLFYFEKNGINDDENEKLFYQIKCRKDMNDVLTEISADPSFLRDIIWVSYDFHCLDRFTKILVVKSLDKKEKSHLLKTVPFFQEDLDNFDIPISFQFIMEEWKKKEKNQKLFDCYMPEINLIKIQGFIQNLLKVDMNNAQQLLMEIAWHDYNILNYLKTNQIISNEENEILKIYETYSKDQIFCIFLINQDLLYSALSRIKNVLLDRTYNKKKIKKENIKMDSNSIMYRKLILGKEEDDETNQ